MTVSELIRILQDEPPEAQVELVVEVDTHVMYSGSREFEIDRVRAAFGGVVEIHG